MSANFYNAVNVPTKIDSTYINGTLPNVVFLKILGKNPGFVRDENVIVNLTDGSNFTGKITTISSTADSFSVGVSNTNWQKLANIKGATVKSDTGIKAKEESRDGMKGYENLGLNAKEKLSNTSPTLKYILIGAVALGIGYFVWKKYYKR